MKTQKKNYLPNEKHTTIYVFQDKLHEHFDESHSNINFDISFSMLSLTGAIGRQGLQGFPGQNIQGPKGDFNI